MTLQVISRGAAAGDPSADTLYDAFGKTIANFAELYGIYGSEIEAFTFTTKQNDLAVAAGTRILRWNGAGTTGITGIAAPSTARVVTIVNASTDYLLWLENENTASVAANRLMLPDSFPAFLMPGDTITLLYDLTTARWRVLSWPNQGPAMGLTEFYDCMGISGPFSTISSGTGAGLTAASTGVDTTGRAAGVMALQTGTTTAGRCSHGSGTGAHIVPAIGPALAVARMAHSTAVDGTDTFQTLFGFHDAQNGTLTDGVAWEYRWNGAAPELAQTVFAATVVARSTTGSPSVPAASTYIWLIVFMNSDWTRADFIYSTNSIAFTLAGSVAAGLPSSTQIVAYDNTIIKSAGTNSRTCSLDLMGYRLNQVRA